MSDRDHRPRIAFVVNGTAESAMGERARAFAERLESGYEFTVLYRGKGKVSALLRFFAALLRLRPRLVYVFDIGFSGALAALAYTRASGAKLIVDSGDPIHELGKSLGRGPLGLAVTRLLEESAIEGADALVVRGTRYKEALNARGYDQVTVVQDGVDPEQYSLRAAGNVEALRRELGLEDVLSVGLIGTSVWSERHQFCYGWDLIESLALLRGRAVKGVVIGGGNGIAHLKQRCAELGIEDRVVFLGFVPYAQLPRYLAVIDVCLSTQSNDRVGQFRTTGKLPLYLSMERFILASDVGEAGLVLNPAMRIAYAGVKDDAYPQRLAERIDGLLAHPELRELGIEGRMLALEKFNYAVLAARVSAVLRRVLAE